MLIKLKFLVKQKVFDTHWQVKKDSSPFFKSSFKIHLIEAILLSESPFKGVQRGSKGLKVLVFCVSG